MNYILGSASLTVFVKGKPYTVSRTAHIFPIVLQALKNKDEKALLEALDMKQTIVSKIAGVGEVKVENGVLKYGDRAITGLVSTRVMEMMRLGVDIQPMLKFLANLMQNPSSRAVKELFGFMEACDLPITEDGYFLAYKRVRGDYRDVYSGTMDNSVGKVVQMERNLVDEDKDNTCSYGLHFCSYSYLKSFGGERIVVLKINPADVVAIPSDYNNSKGRTCRYEVVGELEVVDNLPAQPLDSGYTTSFKGSKQVDEVAEKVNPSAKLDATKVRKIRQMLEDGKTVSYVAAYFDISERQTRRIRNYEAWANV